VTYILNKLLTSEDPVIQDLARSFDYYVFPNVNPDGYVYTHTTVIAPICFQKEMIQVIAWRLSY
jgi:Predicted carboxypeptidase